MFLVLIGQKRKLFCLLILTIHFFSSSAYAELLLTSSKGLLFQSDGSVVHNSSDVDVPGPYFENKAMALSYNPSVLPEMSEAYEIFERMRTDYQEKAECTNMAHVWAYEEHKKSGLHLMKVFLFFTNRYIRKHRFGWWFHVAPMVLVKDGDRAQSIMLDRRYTTIPLEIKEWTDHFVYSGKACRKIMKFSEYNRKDPNEDCFLLPASMFYWQPRNVRLRDQAGRVKTSFSAGEVRSAYREAF